jgi:steroid 5-alpha reductase family enzyme
MDSIDKGGIVIIIIPFILTLMGFYNFLYFITLGYGLSLPSIGLSLIIMYYDSLNTVSLTLCILLIAYGLRLFTYLFLREFFMKSYKETVQKDIRRINNYSTFINIISWIFCSLLYTSLTSPVYFIIINNAKECLSSYICIGIIIFGFGLEVIADHQKTIAKKKNPKRFVDSGLYKFVRCPNYLGEIIMWLGFFFSAIQIYNSFTQLIIALTGLLTLIFIMFGGARRLEMRQDKNYGDMKEYKKYKSTVPILIPFIPLYSVADYSWLVG